MVDSSVIVSKGTKQYRTRKPQYSPYYQCIEDNDETFERSMRKNMKQNMGTLGLWFLKLSINI